MHRKWLYPYIHKLHHQHVNPLGIASEYAHPVEFNLGNIVPVMAGPLLLGKYIHMFTFLAWMMIRQAETNDTHSGYDFSFSPFRLIPFTGQAEYHDLEFV